MTDGPGLAVHQISVHFLVAAKVVVEHNDNGGPKVAVKHRIIQKGYTNLLSPPGYNSALICLIVSSVVFTEFAIILTFVMAAA